MQVQWVLRNNQNTPKSGRSASIHHSKAFDPGLHKVPFKSSFREMGSDTAPTFKVDDTDSLIDYEGAWSTAGGPEEYLSTTHKTQVSGSKAIFTFNGEWTNLEPQIDTVG